MTSAMCRLVQVQGKHIAAMGRQPRDDKLLTPIHCLAVATTAKKMTKWERFKSGAFTAPGEPLERK